MCQFHAIIVVFGWDYQLTMLFGLTLLRNFYTKHFYDI